MELTGLTTRQAQLADILWRIDSYEAVQEFIGKLPTPEFRRDANLVKQLMLMHFIDEEIGENNVGDAAEVLTKFGLGTRNAS